MLSQNVNAAGEIIPHEQFSPHEFIQAGSKNLTSKKQPTAKPSSFNTQGLLFFPLMLQVSKTHSRHRSASPRHLYVIPLRASAPCLRPLMSSITSWDATLYTEPKISPQNWFSHVGCNLRYLRFQIQTERIKRAFSDCSKYTDQYHNIKEERMEFPKQKMAFGALLPSVSLEAWARKTLT